MVFSSISASWATLDAISCRSIAADSEVCQGIQFITWLHCCCHIQPTYTTSSLWAICPSNVSEIRWHHYFVLARSLRYEEPWNRFWCSNETNLLMIALTILLYPWHSNTNTHTIIRLPEFIHSSRKFIRVVDATNHCTTSTLFSRSPTSDLHSHPIPHPFKSPPTPLPPKDKTHNTVGPIHWLILSN